jgi:beta-xylosidase
MPGNGLFIAGKVYHAAMNHRRLCLAALATTAALTLSAASHANPILVGADPDILIVGDTYYLYPTYKAAFEEKQFHVYSSKDLRTWKDEGTILHFDDVKWIKDDGRTNHGAWAPGILASGGKYYFYYAVGPQDATHPSRIGVAVADKPTGPFKDSGQPLITGGNGWEAIDPFVYRDPKSGTVYLYAGGSAGAKLQAWELGDDLVSLKKKVDVPSPDKFTEGVFIHEMNGTYVISYSHGRWNHADYSIHYATGPSPLGPWTYKGEIAKSDARHKGPGHHCFVKNPKTGEWFIIYHRWDSTVPDGPQPGRRNVAIEKLEFDADGKIKPIKLTDDKVPASPLD